MADGVTIQPLLARFEEFVKPTVIQALSDAFVAARSAMLSSPRRPDRTIWIFSSEECSLRVARRISLTSLSRCLLCHGTFVISISM